MMEMLVQKTYKPHEIIVNEGDEGLGWFILKSGRVGVFKGSLKIAEYSETGSIFGELSGILKRPRTAMLQALTTSEVVCIDCTLTELIRQQPSIARKILVNLAERLVKTTDDFWGAVGSVDDKSNDLISTW